MQDFIAHREAHQVVHLLGTATRRPAPRTGAQRPAKLRRPARAGAGSPFASAASFFMASSMASGFNDSIKSPNASNVTTCSDLNQPAVHLRSTILR